ncbi:MAG: tRNA (N6-isopentenyl adenosine(37)-C2)-methylthiotransferase MiaB [Candidatus Pelagibacter sp. TMED128]|nr:MAG: tRNA (N6-isopentenyl adenosine(37)-C2)-methylthiotransferase MiaB [Candidatus Pelagibacter sp. TMED128]
MNEYDSNRILDLVKKINYSSTKNIEEANCYVLNTCHIREKATQKVYHDIGRLKKEFRNKKKPIVLIAGCVAQAEGEILLKNEKYIDAVVGPQSYHKINRILLNLENKNDKINSTEFEAISKFDELNVIKNSDSQISSFLTIQEGCDKFCKFCVVPYTRGPEYSRSLSEILIEAKQLVYNGAKEIILLGQNVNAYQFKDKKLSDLIYLLSEIEDLKRIRYTTSHPRDFTEDLIETHHNCEKLMPILHLPVQSGSSKILKKMNRNHTVEDYLQIIEKLKEKNSSIKFSSDFIIAYPEETQEDFEKTISLMKKVKFINSYSFIFSPRPGTPAANMKEIDKQVAKDRLKVFQKVSDDIKKNYRKKLINSTAKVLFENKIKNGNKFFGRDEYFNSVIVESNDNLIGKTKVVKFNECNQNTLFGNLISDMKKREECAA